MKGGEVAGTQQLGVLSFSWSNVSKESSIQICNLLRIVCMVHVCVFCVFVSRFPLSWRGIVVVNCCILCDHFCNVSHEPSTV